MEELLAVKMRPKKLDDIIGQKHLIGENKIISNHKDIQFRKEMKVYIETFPSCLRN